MLVELCTGSREPNNQSAYTTRIFFISKYESYHMYKSILIEENKKNLKKKNSVSSGPKVLFCCLKSVPWTGYELASEGVENCENSLLTPTNLSHL